MLRRFFDVNRRASRRLERHLPQAREDLFELYPKLVAEHMNARPRQLLVDVGGGKECPFARYRRPELATHIVAVDVAEEEIRHNRDADEACVADVMRDLPFAPGSVDLIVSRSVVEHLTDVEAFVAASARALKPGGMFIHLFPARFALFAMINRALPHRVARRLLYFLQPQVAGICGFPAFYDRCYESAFTRVLDAHGFDVEEMRVSFHQSRYYDFFLPAFALSAAYEALVRAFGARDLGAYLLVVARRR